MEKSQNSPTPLTSWRNTRVVLLFLVVLGLFCGAGWTFLNKGLYLLPGKMCEGTLERDTVKSVLPSARSADSDSHGQGVGNGLTFWCYVTTSNDSSISGKPGYGPSRVRHGSPTIEGPGTRIGSSASPLAA